MVRAVRGFSLSWVLYFYNRTSAKKVARINFSIVYFFYCGELFRPEVITKIQQTFRPEVGRRLEIVYGKLNFSQFRIFSRSLQKQKSPVRCRAFLFLWSVKSICRWTQKFFPAGYGVLGLRGGPGRKNFLEIWKNFGQFWNFYCF
jgi:hypothetical protein